MSIGDLKSISGTIFPEYKIEAFDDLTCLSRESGMNLLFDVGEIFFHLIKKIGIGLILADFTVFVS